MGEKNVSSQDLLLVVFRLGGEEFGADISQVREIIRVVEITSNPQAPPDITGVINLRGQITTVVNLRRRMGMDDKAADSNSRIVVVEVDQRIVGLMVDSVSEVKYVSAGQVEPVSEVLVNDAEHSCIRGVCKLKDHLLILIDLKKLLADLSRAACAAA